MLSWRWSNKMGGASPFIAKGYSPVVAPEDPRQELQSQYDNA